MDQHACGICITSSWYVTQEGEKICLCCHLISVVDKQQAQIESSDHVLLSTSDLARELARLRDVERKHDKMLVEHAVMRNRLTVVQSTLLAPLLASTMALNQGEANASIGVPDGESGRAREAGDLDPGPGND